MRTSVENRPHLIYDLSLRGVNIQKAKPYTSLERRPVFYDFAEQKQATFSGYSNEKSCGFVDSLFKNLI